MYKLCSQSFGPGGAAAEGEGLAADRSGEELALQLVLKLEEVEQVAEEVVQHIRLVALTQCVPVDSSGWEPQS